ncbi:hypothetical protein C0416_03680 [bacterium]|nr:hypothetical protein [bacterium]
MKMSKRFIPILLATFIGTLFLTGCTDITKSSKYETHKLTYLVNTTGVEGDTSAKLEELKKVVLERVNNFEVANVSAELSNENNFNYLTVELGTIDNIDEIKGAIEQNTVLTLKKQIQDESDYATDIKAKAQAVLDNLKAGADFETTAQNAVLEDPARIFYVHSDFMYRDEVKEVFAEKLFSMEPGTISEELIEYKEQSSPLMPPIEIVSIAKLFDKKDVERITKYEKEVQISHILIAYTGAMRAAETTTRTQEEAKALADEVLAKLNEGQDFATLAKEYSDDPSNKQSGGVLDAPAGQKTYVEQFENAAFALEEDGQLSAVTETPFGYHIIKATKVTPASEESKTETQVKFGVLFYALIPAEWGPLEFDGESLTSIETRYDEAYDPYLNLNFTKEGKESLKSLTEGNMSNIIGIFVGNQLITSFTVKEPNQNGELTILKPATTQEADDLKETFLKEPLPLPIILQESEKVQQE